MKQKFIDFYMNIAEDAANRLSTCKRLTVGSVVVKDDNILSFGYNGTFPGEDNCCEGEDGLTKDSVIHAEENTFMKLLRRGGVGTEGATIFITHQPCINCARMIANCGITTVYYKNEYRCNKGIDLLRKRDISVIKI